MMWKFKKFLPILLIVGLMLMIFSSLGYAQARYGGRVSQPLQANGVFTDDEGNAMDSAVWIYGVKVFADEANSFLGIYNADTGGEATDANNKDEIGEATQYDEKIRMYTNPIYFSDGVYGVIGTGVGYVFYGPQP